MRSRLARRCQQTRDVLSPKPFFAAWCRASPLSLPCGSWFQSSTLFVELRVTMCSVTEFGWYATLAAASALPCSVASCSAALVTACRQQIRCCGLQREYTWGSRSVLRLQKLQCAVCQAAARRLFRARVEKLWVFGCEPVLRRTGNRDENSVCFVDFSGYFSNRAPEATTSGCDTSICAADRACREQIN